MCRKWVSGWETYLVGASAALGQGPVLKPFSNKDLCATKNAAVSSSDFSFFFL